MTYQFLTNITEATSANVMFQWKQFMKGTVGWSCVASGDGLSAFSNSSDVITQFGSGANGMNNMYAWFVLQQPGTTRSFCYQLLSVSTPYVSPSHPGSSSYIWRIKYSVSGFVVGGSSTVTPTAVIDGYTGLEDAGVILGSPLGSDSAPTGSPFLPLDGTYRFQAGGDVAAPNTFYLFTTLIPTAGIGNGLLFDGMISGTYPIGDLDPYLIHFEYSNFCTSTAFFGQGLVGYIKRQRVGEAFTSFGGPSYCLTNGTNSNVYNIVGEMPSNPYNGTDDLLPIIYLRPQLWSAGGAPFYQPGVACGYKGISAAGKWITTQRNTLEMLSVVNPGDRIVINNIALPWNNTTPIL